MSRMLSAVPEGAFVKVLTIEGGMSAMKKIQAMGIFKGADLKVARSSSSGPLIIEVKGSKLAIGRGMAEKIIVE